MRRRVREPHSLPFGRRPDTDRAVFFRQLAHRLRMCVRRLLLQQARSRALEGRFSSPPRCSRRTFASREFTSSSSACSPASIATISAAITAAAVCHAPTTTHPLATTQGQVLAALAAFNRHKNITLKIARG